MDPQRQDEPGPQPEDSQDEAPDEVAAEMMHLLHEGVPLALIADLATPGGPDSPEILAEEGLPDVDWLGEVEREPADLDQLEVAVHEELEGDDD